MRDLYNFEFSSATAREAAWASRLTGPTTKLAKVCFAFSEVGGGERRTVRFGGVSLGGGGGEASCSGTTSSISTRVKRRSSRADRRNSRECSSNHSLEN